MKTYQQIKKENPECVDCFFAFSDEQFAEGIKQHKLEGKQLVKGPYGLIGTEDGVQAFMDFYAVKSKEITETCNPQEVYNYEFNNHECEYTGDDEEAIIITIGYFGAERARTVKRTFGYYEIKD